MSIQEERRVSERNSSTAGMEYRRLGRSELSVSIVGFGASPLGNVFRATDPNDCKRAVHCAIDNGINLFDVSPYYGLTLAEERLGEALVGFRDRIILATKCGRYGDAAFDYRADTIAAGLEDSLRRLRTDHVDLLQVHDVEFGDYTQIINETIPVMRRLQEQGKTRAVGITGYPLRALRHIASTVPVDTILTYCRYNLMITDMDDNITPLAMDRDVGLINASVLNMGLLTERGAPDWHPAPKEVREAGQQAVALCRRRGVSLPEIAIRFALDHPYVSSTLVGMSSEKHVHETLNALAARSDLELIEEIKTILRPVSNFVWSSGRPENHD
jgi:L-galactose dehydrogenase